MPPPPMAFAEPPAAAVVVAAGAAVVVTAAVVEGIPMAEVAEATALETLDEASAAQMALEAVSACCRSAGEQAVVRHGATWPTSACCFTGSHWHAVSDSPHPTLGMASVRQEIW